jgi:DNA-binding NtrC family response regulator
LVSKDSFNILVADDEQGMREGIAKALSLKGYPVDIEECGLKAVEKLRSGRFRLAFVDLRLPDLDGVEIVKRIDTSRVKVVIITAYATIETAVCAMKMGAADYIRKPFDNKDIVEIADRFFGRTTTAGGDRASEAGELQLVYRDRKMAEVVSVIDKIKDKDIPVLIVGESGTGKELVARMIHSRGARSGSPYVGINCAAIPCELLESELFGFEKGSFSGAVQAKPGKFEIAGSGFVFLDEIGDMGLQLQAKLLRVLEEKSFERLGGIASIPLKARVVASTNQDLKEKIRHNDFREDLYYRLNGIKIELPPLRQRLEDIEPLAQHFKDLYTRLYKRERVELPSETIRYLKSYSWPGNVRELKHVIESALVLCGAKKVLLPGDLGLDRDAVGSLSMVGEVERKAILEALSRNSFNRSLAAKALKISRKTLYNKMKKYSIG